MQSTIRYIAYYRVSTEQQGASGLGLDAQKATVAAHLRATSGELISEFTEIESGKRNDRPKLQRAIAECHRRKAILIIAKLDRLSRDAAFILSLKKKNVEFVACDFPQANRFLLTIMAGFAEYERELISKRTIDALAAAKARGKLLGLANPCRTDKDAVIAKAARSNARLATERAEKYLPIIAAIEATGITSTCGIAKALNAKETPTARGRVWHASAVRLILKRR